MSIWDARERSHGVLKSLKSSPVGAAPWPNSEWRVVDARRTTLSKFACKSYMLTAFNMLNLSIITKTKTMAYVAITDGRANPMRGAGCEYLFLNLCHFFAIQYFVLKFNILMKKLFFLHQHTKFQEKYIENK